MVELRDATQADAHAIANVLVQSWRAAYRGLLPDDVLAGLSIPDREQFWSDVLTARPPHTRTVVATTAGAIVGFAATGPPLVPADRADPTLGDLYALYLAPDVWRRGIGTQLHATALDRLHPRRLVGSRHQRTRPALLPPPRLDRHRTLPARPRTRRHLAARTTTPPRPERLNQQPRTRAGFDHARRGILELNAHALLGL